MLTVNTMIDTDAKMTHLAVHGVTAPSQTSQKVGGLVGATDENGYLTPMLAPLDGITDILADYTDARTDFESWLGAALDDAEKAASSLWADNETKTLQKEEDADKRASTETARVVAPSVRAESQEAQIVAAENERAAIGKFEDFVNRYNEVTRFLKENKNVSQRVASLATMFSNSTKEMGALSSIGIVADEGGTLRVNAERVKASLRMQPGGAGSMKGTVQLTERAEKNIRLASFNQKRLFPTVSATIGREENAAKSMYSSKASAANDDFRSRGVFFNLYH